MIILLIGAPGSGKGTQGKILAQALGLVHISIGEIFRDIIKSDSEEAKIFNKFFDVGKLVPDEFVNKIVGKILAENQYDKGCILDGYPRNLEQCVFLEHHTKHTIKVLVLDINDEEATNRILNRVTCKICGTIYNKLSNEDKGCLNCGSVEVVIRKDDNSEIISDRIKIYKEETYPIINYLKKNNEVYMINANQKSQEITKNLLEFVKTV